MFLARQAVGVKAVRLRAGFLPQLGWAPQPELWAGELVLCPESGKERGRLALGWTCRKRCKRVSIGSTHKRTPFSPVL